VSESRGSISVTVGEALNELLDDQIDDERTNKASLESRGLAVITTSGALVTLLLGLAALVTKAQSYTPSLGARLLLIAALAAFLVAAALGIYCNVPRRYRELQPGSLRTLTAPDVWTAPGAKPNVRSLSPGLRRSARPETRTRRRHTPSCSPRECRC
jgi:hypothetical protein